MLIEEACETMDRVRIGFIGVGGMGQCAHLKNYVAVPECEVTAIAELRPGLREAVGRKYGIARTYPSGGEMLEREKFDGLVVCQMFDRHGQIVIPLYRHGIPIFTEKPLAASVEVGERMLRALKAGGSWHMVGYHKRSDPAILYAKAEIDRLKQTGELGKLRYVRLTMPAGDWVQGGFDDLIKTEEKVPDSPRDVEENWSSPHLQFVNYYIHQINLLRHLLGEPYRVTFADKAGTLLVAESASGLSGIIEMNPYLTSRDWQESALVCFEKGWIKVELPAPLVANRAGDVTVFRDPGNGVAPQTIRPVMPTIHAMKQQAIHFVRSIRGEVKPPCEAEEALEDLCVAREYMRLRGNA